LIPRLHHRKYGLGSKGFAFGRGELARPLCIYIDGENVSPSESLDLLTSFAAHAQVDVMATDGSTPDRVIVGPLDTTHGYRPWNVERANGSGFISGVPGNIPDIARTFAVPGQEDEAERLMTLAQGTASHGSDALVTTSNLLLNGFPRNLVQEANPMPPHEAVALLGLFLRARDDFVFSIQPNYSENMDRGAFYMILMRDLIPSSWRWFSGCVRSAQHTQDDRLIMLGQSAMERIEYALRARDRLHERLQVPQTRDTGTDVIFYFNVVLLMLGGSLDAIALVAHCTHGISLDEHLVGWTRRQWMREVRRVNPALGQLMDQGHPCRDARDLVAVLRNTIHSDALRTVTWHVGGARDERVVVPEAVADRLEEIANRLGSPAEFGLSRDINEMYVDPGVFVEATLPRVAGVMNALMDATPIENLAGVDSASLMNAPPNDAFFSAAARSRVRMLGGLDRR
jgi:hypothetical protein